MVLPQTEKFEVPISSKLFLGRRFTEAGISRLVRSLLSRRTCVCAFYRIREKSFKIISKVLLQQGYCRADRLTSRSGALSDLELMTRLHSGTILRLDDDPQ